MDASNRVPFVIGKHSPIKADNLSPKEWAEIVNHILTTEKALEHLSGFRPFEELANDGMRHNSSFFTWPHVAAKFIAQEERSLHLLAFRNFGRKVFWKRRATREVFLSRKRKLVVWDATWEIDGKHGDHGTTDFSRLHTLETLEDIVAFLDKKENIEFRKNIVTGIFFAVQETVKQRFYRLEHIRETERDISAIAGRLGINVKSLNLRFDD